MGEDGSGMASAPHARVTDSAALEDRSMEALVLNTTNYRCAQTVEDRRAMERETKWSDEVGTEERYGRREARSARGQEEED